MTRLRKLLRTLLFVLAPALLLTGSTAFAQSITTGTIKGSTVDEGGLPIPGVVLTLSSDSMIGGSQQRTTDQNGRFIFAQLQPGLYELRAEKAGFATLRKPNLQVLIGRSVTLPIEMKLAGEGEEIIVEDTRPTIDTEQTSRGEVMSKEFLSKVPTGRSYQDAVSSAAGVTGGANPNVGGAASDENTYMIDGVDITDPVTGTFSLNFNFDAIEQLEVLTGAFDPEYPQNLGGIINIVTETGGNQLEFDTSVYYNNADWSPVLDARFAADGLEIAPTGFDSTYAGYELNAKISGPIVRDRVWFIISYSQRRTLISNVGIDLPRDYEGHYVLAKVTAQPNSAHRFTVLFQSNPTSIDNLDQSDRYVKPEAQYRQAQGGFVSSVQWDWFINPETIAENRIQVQKIFIDVTGVPCTHDLELGYHPCQPGEEENSLDFTTPGRTGLYGAFDQDNYGFFYFDDRWRLNVDSKWSLLQREFWGSHDLKTGITFNYVYWDQVVGYNGNLIFYDLNATSDPDTYSNYYWIETSTPYNLVQDGLSGGAFVQDVWKPIDNLTFRYGVRYDHAYLVNDTGDTTISMGTFGPRFYTAWDPFGDEKTKISGGYGRFNSLGNMGVISYLSQSGLGQKLYVGEYFGEFTSDPGASYFVIDNENNFSAHDTLTAPHSDEFVIGGEREIVQDVAFVSNFTAKFTRNVWEFDETNRIWDQDGYNTVGQSNGDYEDLWRLRTPTVARRDYYQTDIGLRKNWADRWLLRAIYSYVVSRGTVLNSQSGNLSIPPQLEYSYGNLGTDVRHQFKGAFAWDLPNDPWTTNVGMQIEYFSGYPVSRYYYTAGFGSAYMLKQPLGTYARTEPVYYLDFQISQDFDVRKGELSAILILENVLNSHQPDYVSGYYVWYQNRWVIYDRQNPLGFNIGVSYKF